MTLKVIDMWLLMLEAGVALFLLVFIVWWTAFSGKKPTQQSKPKPLPPKDDAQL
jgi:cbb3-type cytochrome oxidase subunit 3